MPRVRCDFCGGTHSEGKPCDECGWDDPGDESEGTCYLCGAEGVWVARCECCERTACLNGCTDSDEFDLDYCLECHDKVCPREDDTE